MSKPVPGRQQGQKPVHLVAASGYCTPQEAVWELVRELKVFTVADLMSAALHAGHNDLNQETTKSYVARLHRGNYLKVAKIETVNRNTKRHIYELINDVGVDAPRLKKDGTVTTQGMGRENMWRAMRILNVFDWKELAQSSSNALITVKDQEAKDYVKHLKAAGYLQVVTPAKRFPSKPARVRLARYTGPKPPMIQRIKRVFDPNLNEVMGEIQEGK